MIGVNSKTSRGSNKGARGESYTWGEELFLAGSGGDLGWN